jgi:DNA-binding response OmpR family regulator
VRNSLNVSLLSRALADRSQTCGKPGSSVSALLASNVEEDHRFLNHVFLQHQWTLLRTDTVEAALSFLRKGSTPVVMSDRDVPGGGWKKILSGLQHLSNPPLLVVTSRLADERLWAEVLNLGGHDVLATPFREKELEWVLENAWRRFGFTSNAKTMSAFATGF